jgi:hypothetical protein
VEVTAPEAAEVVEGATRVADSRMRTMMTTGGRTLTERDWSSKMTMRKKHTSKSKASKSNLLKGKTKKRI